MVPVKSVIGKSSHGLSTDGNLTTAGVAGLADGTAISARVARPATTTTDGTVISVLLSVCDAMDHVPGTTSENEYTPSLFEIVLRTVLPSCLTAVMVLPAMGAFAASLTSPVMVPKSAAPADAGRRPAAKPKVKN